jgi:hypothetical protein
MRRIIPSSLRHRAGLLAVASALSALSGAARAEDSMFTLSGFGTLAATHSSIEQGDYVSSLYQTAGSGHSRGTDLATDSKFAAQLDARVNDQLSAVVQLVALSRTNGKWEPRVEWANVKYAITPTLSVRLGRTALPGYMLSDSRLVGYTMHWIRPPIETYSLNSITNSDGVDVSWRSAIGEVGNTLQSWYGTTKVDIVGQTGHVTKDVKAKKLYGIADSVEFGSFTARAGITVANLEIVPAPGFIVTPQVRQFNIGATYDPGNWFVQSEYSTIDFEHISRAQKAFYVTGGVRVGKLTPFVTYSQVRPDDGQVKLTTRDQKAWSLGMRWDAHKRAAVKVQVDHISLANGNVGFFTNAQPGLAGRSGNIATVAVDFVY